MKDHPDINRRTFLYGFTAASTACFLKFPFLITKHKSISKSSRVITVRNDSIRKEDGSVKKDKLQNLLFSAIQKQAGKDNPSDAWGTFFSKNETVGIKVNCLAGRGMSTHIVLVEAIISGLKMAGISEQRIIVWDRTDVDLMKAGFKINKYGTGYRCYGTNHQYDGQLGVVESGSVGSLFSPILSKYCDSIINVPILKDHDLAGITASMKNFYGAIHNPNKYHDNACTPYIADLMAVPMIQDKLKLTICDALSIQYHGGPSYKPKWKWDYNGLLISTDPVAIDSIGYKIIDKKRRKEHMTTLKGSKREPLYIQRASDLRLGKSKYEEIEVISL